MVSWLEYARGEFDKAAHAIRATDSSRPATPQERLQFALRCILTIHTLPPPLGTELRLVRARVEQFALGDRRPFSDVPRESMPDAEAEGCLAGLGRILDALDTLPARELGFEQLE